MYVFLVVESRYEIDKTKTTLVTLIIKSLILIKLMFYVMHLPCVRMISEKNIGIDLSNIEVDNVFILA